MKGEHGLQFTAKVVLTACLMAPPRSLSGTPPRGKRRVWFADEILGRRSESAPGSPVRGPPFLPLVTEDGDVQGESPAASPQIRRALRPHRTAANVGPRKTQHGICPFKPELMPHRVSALLIFCLLGGLWPLRLGDGSSTEQLQPHPPGWPPTHPHLYRRQRR